MEYERFSLLLHYEIFYEYYFNRPSNNCRMLRLFHLPYQFKRRHCVSDTIDMHACVCVCVHCDMLVKISHRAIFSRRQMNKILFTKCPSSILMVGSAIIQLNEITVRTM